MRGKGNGGRISTDNTTRCDCSGDVLSRRKYIDTPPSSIALIICTLPRLIWEAFQYPVVMSKVNEIEQ